MTSFFNFRSPEEQQKLIIKKVCSGLYDNNYDFDNLTIYMQNKSLAKQFKHLFYEICPLHHESAKSSISLDSILKKGKIELSERKFLRSHPEALSMIEHRSTKIELWLIITNVKRKMAHNQNYYKEIMSKNFCHPKTFHKSIELDIIRTHPSSVSAQEKIEVLEISTRILIAFSRRNPVIGYCQGLNFIVVEILLLGLKEEVSLFSS